VFWHFAAGSLFSSAFPYAGPLRSDREPNIRPCRSVTVSADRLVSPNSATSRRARSVSSSLRGTDFFGGERGLRLKAERRTQRSHGLESRLTLLESQSRIRRSERASFTTSSTTPAGTYQILIVFTETISGPASAIALLPILLSPLMFLRRRWAGKGFRFAACLARLAAAAVATNGCGGGGGSITPPTQTHQITNSATVTLTVQ
jgi:hypothetical protein